MADDEPLLRDVSEEDDEDDEDEFKLYGRRWYIVAVAACLTAMQGGYWNNFGPIAQAVKPLLGVSNAEIALWANYGPIGYILTILPSTWLLDVKGLRTSSLVCLWLVFISSLVKCFVADSNVPLCVVLIHIGQFLNGLAGPISMSIGPVVSATWFPPRQRATATALISVSNYGGCALMFVLGPYLVPSPGNPDDDDNPIPLTPAQREQISSGLLRYMRYETILAGLLLLLCHVYFPNRPPTPPSRTASIARIDFKQGMQDLLKCRNFWLCSVSYGILTGFYGAWGSMLGPNLQNVLPAASAQSDAGWIGFWGSIAGAFGGILAAAIADRAKEGGRMRLMTAGFCCVGSVVFLLFALACEKNGIIPLSVSLLYLFSVLGGFFVNSTIPLYYELGVEAAYPIAEGLSTGVLTLMNNFACLAFLLIPLIPGLGTAWMNWSIAGAAGISFALMLPFKEQNMRRAIDTGEPIASNSKITA